MHPRHRSPGNGYRSGSISMGMGLASSRISPEGSVRSHGGIYGAEYRSFNRSNSFARGQGYAKPFHSSQAPLPPSGRSGFVDDIFMEAGRLAAEYLVSKGLLPPSALSSEWENGRLKKEHGEFHESRLLEGGENIQYSPEGRPSALASRLGNAGSDPGLSRRRSSDEFSSLDLRNQVKGKRKAAPLRVYESNRSDREYGRSVSLPDRARVPLNIEPNVGVGTVCGYKNQYEVGDYNGEGLQKPVSSELTVESENKLESELTDKKTCDDTEDLPQENDDQFNKVSDGSKILTSGTEDVKDNSSSEVTGDQSVVEKQSDPSNVLIFDPPVKPPNDLLASCGFAKFPTKIRSALSYKGSKVGRVVISEQKKPIDNSTQIDPEVLDDSKFSGGSIYDGLSKEADDLKQLNSEVTSPVTTQGTGVVDELYPTFIFKPVECGNSQTLVNRDCLGENESLSVDETSVFGENTFAYKYGGQKRAPEESDIREETKKPREIPMAAKEDSSFHLPDFSERKFNSNEGETPDEEHVMEVNCGSSLDFGFPKDGVEPCVEYGQEKQLFPSSFKICDLNLMEATDMHENHGNDSIMFFPSVSQTKREKSPFGMDLSMTNSNGPSEGNKHIRKEIEIIDLEDDLVDEEQPFNNAERKTETLYTSLDTFPHHAQNTNGLSDVQDGYGLISELLGADFPSCSSVSGDINLIDNEMVLHNGQGTLTDDDSIYLSLEEIPLTFLRAWDQQPTQEYEKPF